MVKSWLHPGLVKNPGSLRIAAKEQRLIKGKEKLSSVDLNQLSNSSNPTTRKRAVLAKTFKGFNNK